MGLAIKGRQIDRVFVIDDDKYGRESSGFAVEESPFEPVIQESGITNLNSFLENNIHITDAVVSDHHLKKRNYFPENGAKVVYECYERQIPAVLVTRFGESEINEIRKFREKIPVVLTPGEFNPDSLINSLETCINEFLGNRKPERVAWRTLIRIEDVVDNNIFIFIPGWNYEVSISLNKQDLPRDIRNIIKADMRVHAKVNVGAERSEDLFFKDWEAK
jgi:hypothetical protein